MENIVEMWKVKVEVSELGGCVKGWAASGIPSHFGVVHGSGERLTSPVPSSALGGGIEVAEIPAGQGAHAGGKKESVGRVGCGKKRINKIVE